MEVRTISRELFTKIPEQEISRVFNNSEYASAELDFTFLGFENVYKAATLFVPKDYTIIDLGCAYAAQAFYFKNYKMYIGVDCGVEPKDVHFQIPKMAYCIMTIQKFCKKVIDEKWDLEKVFAICSYVPDEEAREIVRRTFPNLMVYYPEIRQKKHEEG